MRAPMRWTLNLTAIMGTLCGLCAVLLFLLGGRVVTIASDSMSPGIPVGSLAVTLRGDANEASPPSHRALVKDTEKTRR